jgi:hypothetical protein
MPPCPACGRRPVSRKRVYDDGQTRWLCGQCNAVVGSIEERWGRGVEVFKRPIPELDTMRVRLIMAEHAIGEPDDETEVMAWLQGLARTAASSLFPAAEGNGRYRRPG